MVYEYVTTYRSYLDDQRLYLQHHRRAAVVDSLWRWVPSVLGLVATLPLVFVWLKGEPEAAVVSSAAIAVAGLYFAIALPLRRRYRVRRHWRRIKPKHREGKAGTIEFTEECVIAGIPGESEGRFFWKSIVDFGQDDRVTLLFLANGKYLFIPTDAVPAEEWARVKAMVGSRPRTPPPPKPPEASDHAVPL